VLHLAPAHERRIVPACPQWTVHDVVAHLAGGCGDVLAGDIEGVTTAAWVTPRFVTASNWSSDPGPFVPTFDSQSPTPPEPPISTRNASRRSPTWPS
jgi:hypothetical protein